MENGLVHVALDELIYVNTYESSEEIKLHLKKWAIKNNFALVVDKSDKNKRLHLRCKIGNTCRITVKNPEERKRKRDSFKNDCPFVIKLRFLTAKNAWAVTRPNKEEQEHLHNHSLSVEGIQVLPEGKRGLIGSKSIRLVTDMIQAGSSVPEIRKTLGGRDGESILSYHDIRNWRAENTSSFNISTLENDARNLVSHIASKGYLVSYRKSLNDSESRSFLTSVYFMHQSAIEELKNRCEVFIIDATYKVNNLGMPLISVQGVSHLGGDTLMTTPIAYAFVSNEQKETYIWFLNALKQAMFSNDSLDKSAGMNEEECRPVFVTDKCAALMNAIEHVFPTSQNLLCTWHISQNFKNELSNIFVDSENKQICMELLKKMMVTTSEYEFKSFYKEYKAIATNDLLLKDCSSYEAQEYLDNNWMICKDKWAGYLTCNNTHFGCTTTQRVEGSHSALKRGAMSSRVDLLVAFSEVDKYIKRQIVRQKTATVTEGCKVDGLIRKNLQLTNLIGMVSAKALFAIHKATLQIAIMSEEKKSACLNEVCSCFSRICYKLPCKHELVKLGDKPLDVRAVDSRWLLQNAATNAVHSSMMNDSEKIDKDPSHDNERERITFDEDNGLEQKAAKVDQFSRILREAEIQFRDCQSVTESNALADFLTKALKEYQQYVKEYRGMDSSVGLPKTENVSKIGRPAKEKSYSSWRQNCGSSIKVYQAKEGNAFTALIEYVSLTF